MFVNVQKGNLHRRAMAAKAEDAEYKWGWAALLFFKGCPGTCIGVAKIAPEGLLEFHFLFL